MTDRAALASVRKRFPGFEQSMGRAVMDMAELKVEHKPVRGWTSVEPFDPKDPLPNGWIAHLHVLVTETKQEFTLPVVPDEHNPRPDKIVRPEDKPWVFTYMSEAEQAAAKELPGLIHYITSRL